jgi:large subunit ribosomal protein L25
MKVAKLKGERRTALGRNQVNHLRAQGWLPAVVYGDNKESMSIAISEWELEQHIKHHHKVFQLEIDGTSQAAFLQDIQWDVLTDHPRHVDFKRVDLNKPIAVEIEATFIGYPVGGGKGGTLIKDHARFMVNCLPTAIPEVFEVDVTKLDLDQSILAKDLVLPEGVTLAVSGETVICHVAKLTGPAEAAPAPAGEAAPAAGAPAAAPAAGGKAAPAPKGKG